jgi:hypothetical protein
VINRLNANTGIVKDEKFKANTPVKKEAGPEDVGTSTKLTEPSKETLVPADRTKSSSKVVPHMSFADQAATPPPPPPPETPAERARRLERAAFVARFGEAALDAMQTRTEATTAANIKEIHEMGVRSRLLPRLPGGVDSQYVSYFVPTLDARRRFTANEGNDIKMAEKEFGVKFDSIFELDSCHKIWPEPADWEQFKADPEADKVKLANAREFIQFFIWDYEQMKNPDDRHDLGVVLGYYGMGESQSRYAVSRFIAYLLREEAPTRLAVPAPTPASPLRISKRIRGSDDDMGEEGIQRRVRRRGGDERE